MASEAAIRKKLVRTKWMGPEIKQMAFFLVSAYLKFPTRVENKYMDCVGQMACDGPDLSWFSEVVILAPIEQSRSNDSLR